MGLQLILQLKGQFSTMQMYCQMTGDENQRRKDSLTPLQLAAGKGHFQFVLI